MFQETFAAMVTLPMGLHMRPMVDLHTALQPFRCTISVITPKFTADGKELFDLMRLEAGQGTMIRFVAEGDDATAALKAAAQVMDEINMSHPSATPNLLL